MDSSPPDEQLSRSARAWSSVPLLVAAFLFALALGIGVLYRRHPNEDAYILFKYAELLATGHGIVYWPGGPHAEGATDFLWMLLIAGARTIGCDVAVAAVVGNAFGAAILVGLCVREWTRWTAANALQRILALLFLVSGPAFAAYVGFSALLYAALAAWTFRRTLAALLGEGSAVAIPWMCIALALFRPDGVILGVGFTLVALLGARRRGELRRFAIAAAGALAVGVAYAVWRSAYFGLPLPLPLYVKSRASDLLPGLERNWIWLKAWNDALPLISAVVVLILIARPSRKQLSAFVLCMLPAVAHFASLAFARQTQNFGSRFQGPELAILFVSVFFWTARAAAIDRSRMRRVLAHATGALALLPLLNFGRIYFHRMWSASAGYADTFGVELGAILRPDDVLALTEAGRLSYWTSARVEDVVGLNSAAAALQPPTVEWLRAVDPDVFLFYAGPFMLMLHIADKQPVVEIPPEMLSASVRPEYRFAFQGDETSRLDELTPELRGTLALARFAVESGAYDLYAVDVLGNYAHVYGIRKGHRAQDALVGALEATASGRLTRTYAQSAGLPWAGP
jgi:hypothetical protein